MAKNKSISRKRREREFGVECVDRVIWKSWEVGSVYSQQLTIKNISMNTQTFSFNLPEHKEVFLMSFPEPITLHAGMSHTFEITFVPQKFQEVHDVIEITLHEKGSFVVFLDALTPFASVDIVNVHDFMYCAVGTSVSASVTMANTGTISLPFMWYVSPPFTISPWKGVLEESKSIELVITFAPEKAESVIEDATCKMEGTMETMAVLKLTGVGKYAFVHIIREWQKKKYTEALKMNQIVSYQDSTIAEVMENAEIMNLQREITNKHAIHQRHSGHESQGPIESLWQLVTQHGAREETVIDEVDNTLITFGDVVAGCAELRSVYVENPSFVTANVVINSIITEDAHICPFSVEPNSFTILPGRRQRLSVKFISYSTDAVFCEQLRLEVTGGYSIALTLTAKVISPNVDISTTLLCFDEINLDEIGTLKMEKHSNKRNWRSKSHFVCLRNKGSKCVDFEFVELSETNGFAVNPNKGQLLPNSLIKLQVKFEPSMPIIYVRRLFLLLNNASKVIYLDVFGSAYNCMNRPFRLTSKEIKLTCKRCITNSNNNNSISYNDDYWNRYNTVIEIDKRRSEQEQHYCTENIANHTHTSTELPRLKENVETTINNNLNEIASVITTTTTTINNKNDNSSDDNNKNLSKFQHIDLKELEEQESSELEREHFKSYREPQEVNKTELSLNTLFVPHARVSPFCLTPTTLSFLRQDNTQQAQLVTLHNKSNQPAWVSWHVSTYNNFVVSPMEQEVQPNSSFNFTVSLICNSNKNCKEYLECYVNYSIMRSFRTTPDERLVLPWCFTLLCRQLFVENCTTMSTTHLLEITPKMVELPETSLEQTSFHTVSITNVSDFPVFFNVSSISLLEVRSLLNEHGVVKVELNHEDSQLRETNIETSSYTTMNAVANETTMQSIFTNNTNILGSDLAARKEKVEKHDEVSRSADSNTNDNEYHLSNELLLSENRNSKHDLTSETWASEINNVFTCYPNAGYLSPRERQSVVFKFTPPPLRCACYIAQACIHSFGNGVQTTTPLRLIGHCTMPHLLITPQSLIFAPTSIYGHNVRSMRLYNPTTLPLLFEMTSVEEEVISLSCTHGEIMPNEEVRVKVAFAPTKVQCYDSRISVFFTHVQSNYNHTNSSSHDKETKESCERVSSSLTKFLYKQQHRCGGLSTLYCMTIPFRGKGCIPRIEISPTTMNLGELSCAHEHHYTFTIYNSSLCATPFEVKITPDFAANDTNNGYFFNKHHSLPTLRHHRGIVQARSHATVQMSVLPSPGKSSFIVYVHVRATENDNNDSFYHNTSEHCCVNGIHDESSAWKAEETVTLDKIRRNFVYSVVTFVGIEPIIRVVDVYSAQCNRAWLWEQFSLEQLNEFLSNHSINSEDRNRLCESNARTRTQENSLYNHSTRETKTQLTSRVSTFQETAKHAETLFMDLGVGSLGSVSFTTSMLFENSGDYPVELHFWFPTEQQVNWEHWYTQDELLNDINDLLQLGVITISPRSTRVEPHECRIVSFTYNFALVGVHTLPVLFSAEIIGANTIAVSENGKIEVLLVLEGRTLPIINYTTTTTTTTTTTANNTSKLTWEPSFSSSSPTTLQKEEMEQSYLLEANKSIGVQEDTTFTTKIGNTSSISALNFHHCSQFGLTPVLLGDMQPPLQGVWLDNPLNMDVQYAVDIEELEAITRSNNNFPLLTCVNPLGLVHAGECMQLFFYFRPLEAKEYVLPVTIHTYQGEQYKITLTGKGVYPHEYKEVILSITEEKEKRWLYLSSHPRKELRLHMPVILSDDVIRFGVIPFNQSYTHVCILTNNSSLNRYFFRWCVTTCNTTLCGNHTIQFEPSMGVVEPHSTILVRITLYSGSMCQVLEQHVKCMVYIMETDSATEHEIDNTHYLNIIDQAYNLTKLPLSRHKQKLMHNTSQHANCGKKSEKNKAATTKCTASASTRVTRSSRMEEQRTQNSEVECIDVLHVLVQAHIIPVEQFESYYERDVRLKEEIELQHEVMLTTNEDNKRNTIINSEKELLHNTFDELIRAVVNASRVKETLETAFSPEIETWEHIRAKCKLSKVNSSLFTQEIKRSTEEQKTQISKELDELVTTRSLLHSTQCDLKKLYDNVIFSLMSSTLESELELYNNQTLE